MASINIEELQKRLQCAICLDTVYNPKRLICNHSFCKDCLDKALKFNADGSAILKCPKKCDAKTRISPQQTTNNLQVDYMLKDVLDVTQSTSGGTEERVHCHACSRDVTRWCMRCQHLSCDHCDDPHEDEANFLNVAYHGGRREVVVICREHSTEAEYICRVCELDSDDDFVCVYCVHRDHKSHEYDVYRQVEDRLKSSMKGKIAANADHVTRTAKVVKNLATVEQQFEKAVKTHKLKCINEYIEHLNTEEEKLRGEFKEGTKNLLESFGSVAYFEECLSKSGTSFMLQRNEILRRLNDFPICGPSNDTIADVSFQLGNTNFSGEHPLGSIRLDYSTYDPSNNTSVKFHSANHLWQSYIFSLKHSICQFTDELTQGGGSSSYADLAVVQDTTEELDDEIDEHSSGGKKILNFTVNCKHGDVVLSEPVMVANLPWRIKLVPLRGAGHRTGKRFVKSAGIFLQCDPDETWRDWSCQVRATITVKRSDADGPDLTRTVSNLFSSSSTECGYGSFMSWRDAKNFAKNHVLNIEAVLQVGEPQGVFLGSRNLTGCVGLKKVLHKQGYWNSYLQPLFFTNLFRKLIYEMPTGTDHSCSPVFTLQRVFYELQCGTIVPAEVTEKFLALWTGLMVEAGLLNQAKRSSPNFICFWHRCLFKLFHQYNPEMSAKSLSLVLYPVAEGVSVVEDRVAYSVLLNEYTESALSDDDIKAVLPALISKGEAPPILYLFLYRLDENTRYSFSDKLDLSKYQIGGNENSVEIPLEYSLHSVTVHSKNETNGGDFVAYINPRGDGNWYKFQDNIVYPVTKVESIDRIGGSSADSGRSYPMFLTYIKTSALDEILCEVTHNDIPDILGRELVDEKIAEAQAERDDAECHLYLDVQVLTEEHFHQWSGPGLFNTRATKPVNFRILKDETLESATKIIAESYGYNTRDCHVWPLCKFNDHHVNYKTTSLVNPLIPIASLTGLNETVLLVFLQAPGFDNNSNNNNDLQHLSTYVPSDETVLVHFKYYIPSLKVLSYCGYAHVFLGTNVEQLHPLLRQRAGLAEDTPLLLYGDDFREIADGDIILFQKVGDVQKYALPNPIDYIEHMMGKFEITFVDRTQSDTAWRYTSHADMRFTEVMEEVAQTVLNVAPGQVLFFKPIKQTGEITRTQEKAFFKIPGEMIRHTNTRSVKDIAPHGLVFYRVLTEADTIQDIELREFKCIYVDTAFKTTSTLAFEITRSGMTVGDILTQCVTMLKKRSTEPKLRLVQISACKIQRIISPCELLDAFIKHSQDQYRIETILDEEIVNDEENEFLVPVMHFHNAPSKTFGQPFFMKLVEGEFMRGLKERVLRRLQFSEPVFKLARVCMGKVTYLRDEELGNKVKLVDFKPLLGQPQMLGLDYEPPQPTVPTKNTKLSEAVLVGLPRNLILRRKVKVSFEIGHEAVCRETPTASGHTHNWCLYMCGVSGADMSHYVDKVVFTLHSSFPNRRRVRRIHPYRIHETGWGSFKVGVEVYFQHAGAPPYKFEYDLNLQLLGHPPYSFKLIKENLFCVPKFEEKLLRGGGKAVLPL